MAVKLYVNIQRNLVTILGSTLVPSATLLQNNFNSDALIVLCGGGYVFVAARGGCPFNKFRTLHLYK